jgi:flagellar motor switch protein FliM
MNGRFVAPELARAMRWDLLPRVSRAQARVARVLGAHLARRTIEAQVAPALRLAFANHPPHLTWSAPTAFPRVETSARLPAPLPAVRFRRADGRGVIVTLEPAMAVKMIGRLLGAPPEFPAPRGLTLVERGVLAGLAALAAEAYALPGLRVEGVADDPAALSAILCDPWVVSAEARLTAGDLEGQIRVLVPESVLHQPPPSRRPLEPPIAEVRLAAALVVARVTTSATRLAALTPGQVLRAGERRLFLRAGGGFFPVRYAAASLHVLAPWRRGDPMSAGEDTTEHDLAVPLDCRLARLSLSLRELTELTPGAVLGLGKPLGASIDLVAGERVIARGELVDVEGELGVRLVELRR